MVTFLCGFCSLKKKKSDLLFIRQITDRHENFIVFTVEGMKVKDLSYIFAPGDYVEVADGELVNLRGRVQSVDGEKVVMLPDHEDLKVFCIF